LIPEHPQNFPEVLVRFQLCLLPVLASVLHAQQPLVEVFLPTAPTRELASSLSQARRAATIIYADIGIRIAWRPTTFRPDGCTKAPLHGRIVVAFESGARGYNDAVLGYSKPFAGTGPCVILLIDRLRDAVETNPTSNGFLLGHVLAHEIGHVLEGSSRHSERGVMKVRWSLHETENMRGHLVFAPEDAERIREALRPPL
jgi:hypothetical protein